MKFENTQVFNFEGAFRGMRNPMNSWDKSDSFFGIINKRENPINEMVLKWEESIYDNKGWYIQNGIINRNTLGDAIEVVYLGPKDLDLAQRLIKGGPEHRKFLRQIFVSVDITAPLFYFKELDTYKIGTTANSTSTMHKLASTPITLDCFEIDDYDSNAADSLEISLNPCASFFETDVIPHLERLRKKYLDTQDKRYWKELIRWLPESWLQTRTITMNYENLRSICAQREGHKLTEWKTFIDWAKSLPYAEELIFYK